MLLVIALAFGLLALLALNAFFVLAEFAIVKVRPSRVEELVAAGDARAERLAGVQQQLDEYLGVTQVGITLASVALGMVGKKLSDVLLGNTEHALLRTIIAIGVSYVVVSGSHVVLGELVPKSIAIRLAERSGLWCAGPLRFFRKLFYPAFWVVTSLANLVLRLLRLPPTTGEDGPREGELRIILDRSQEQGTMSFRRLLFMENVFDFGALTARDAMRPRDQVRCLDARVPWEESLNTIRAARFSRYPVLDGDPEHPIGLVHLKDVLVRTAGPPDLRGLARPILWTTEGTPLENLLDAMQRQRRHAALVTNADGRWTGLVTFEDVVEELVGTIRDEFEDEEPVRLADVLTVDRIHLDVEAPSPLAAVETAMRRMAPGALPAPAGQLLRALADRERTVSTYLGKGVGLPHARLPALQEPFAMVIRSGRGIPCAGTKEKAYLLFVLLTPQGRPRSHQQLQSVIATLLHESGFVTERLRTATTPADVLEVIRTGEQASLS